MVKTGSIDFFKNRPGPAQEECCLKKEENFSLTLFWYSALKVQYLKPQNLIDSETQSAIDPINPLVYIQAS